jgi:protein-S-isoprenylcysteine O-methyltransferase Ste14
MEAADMATSRAAGDQVNDERTAQLFEATMAVAVAAGAASILQRGRRPLPRSRASFRAGIAGIWTGIAVNRWARGTLKGNYRSVVTIVADQQIVNRGPYKLIRHPMYLGSSMICAGVGSALATWPTAVAWTFPPLALVRRINVEERVLIDALGERYQFFAASRARLVPGLW